VNQQQGREAIAKLVNFKASALSAYGGKRSNTGRLAGDDYENYLKTEDIDYTVLSYDTPIAWHTESGIWYLVSQRFSRTTSCHQRIVGSAIQAIEKVSA
jgi:hypothetical protein